MEKAQKKISRNYDRECRDCIYIEGGQGRPL